MSQVRHQDDFKHFSSSWLVGILVHLVASDWCLHHPPSTFLAWPSWDRSWTFQSTARWWCRARLRSGFEARSRLVEYFCCKVCKSERRKWRTTELSRTSGYSLSLVQGVAWPGTEPKLQNFFYCNHCSRRKLLWQNWNRHNELTDLKL